MQALAQARLLKMSMVGLVEENTCWLVRLDSIIGVYRGYIGIMEKKMEAIILGFRVQDLGF